MMNPMPCERCGRLIICEETITIPVAEYRELLARPAATFLGKPTRFRLAKDPELADFVVDLASRGTMILKDLRVACVERFGESRVPSLSSLHRYIQETAKGERPQPTLRRKA